MDGSGYNSGSEPLLTRAGASPTQLRNASFHNNVASPGDVDLPRQSSFGTAGRVSPVHASAAMLLGSTGRASPTAPFVVEATGPGTQPPGSPGIIIEDYVPMPEDGADECGDARYLEGDQHDYDDVVGTDFTDSEGEDGPSGKAGPQSAAANRAEVEKFRQKIRWNDEQPYSFWSEQDITLQTRESVALRPFVDKNALHAHQFGTDEMKTMTKLYESLPSRNPHSQAYRAHQAAQRTASSLQRWLLFSLIGLTIGVVGLLLEQTIAGLSEFRQELLTSEFEEGTKGDHWGAYIVGYILWTLTGLGLAAVSTGVILWQPSAGGSGVTDVMAYLNGIYFRKVFNLSTMAAKWLSCVCAVSSGLPVGPEGPMIHMGAIVGAGLAHGRSKALGAHTFSWFKNAGQSPRDHRDAITAGAAAGVACAFGAPIGGMLFVFEEVATHWYPSLTPMIFFCCLFASFISSLFDSVIHGWSPREESTFGTIIEESMTLFPAYSNADLQVQEIFFSVVLGLICGACAVCFTLLNVWISKKRRQYINPNRKFKHAEPLVVLLLFLTISFFLPALFECVPMPEAPEGKRYNGALNGGIGMGGQSLRRSMNLLSSNLLGSGDEPNPAVDANGETILNVTPPHVAELFIKAACEEEDHFNPAATLFWSNGHTIVEILFTQHYGFGYLPLAVFGVLYFFFSCYCCGMAMATGIVIPKLVTGGIIGRLFGVFISGNVTNNQHVGVYAIVGAGAYFAGVSRLTVSLAVIMIELTGAKRVLILVLVAIMVAKLFADQFSHSLYHCLLEIRCVPFLDMSAVEELAKHRHECFRAADICRKRIICIKTRETVGQLRATLRGCTHNGFPVIDDEGRYVGMISRSQLYSMFWVMDRHNRFATNGPFDLPSWGEMATVEEAMFGKDCTQVPDTIAAESTPHDERVMDLTQHVDTSALTVSPAVSITDTMQLFMYMGLRNLPVVNEKGRVYGLITRKELLPCKVVSHVRKAVVSARKNSPQNSPRSQEGAAAAAPFLARRVTGGSESPRRDEVEVLPSDIYTWEQEHEFL